MKTLSFISCSLLILVLATLYSCKKKTCIEKRIEEHGPCLKSVDEYKFRGKIVYLFDNSSSSCADASSQVLDADCNQICSWGGWANDYKCAQEFDSTAVFVKNLFKGNE